MYHQPHLDTAINDLDWHCIHRQLAIKMRVKYPHSDRTSSTSTQFINLAFRPPNRRMLTGHILGITPRGVVVTT